MGQLHPVGQLHQAVGQLQMLQGIVAYCTQIVHNGSATAVSRTQAMCHLGVQSCSQIGLYGLGTFSTICGPEMASEAIPGCLIFPGGGRGGACLWIPLAGACFVYASTLALQLGQCLHTQILLQWSNCDCLCTNMTSCVSPVQKFEIQLRSIASGKIVLFVLLPYCQCADNTCVYTCTLHSLLWCCHITDLFSQLGSKNWMTK